MELKNRAAIIGVSVFLTLGGMLAFVKSQQPAPVELVQAPKADLRDNPLIRGLSDDQKMLQLSGSDANDDDLKQLSARIFRDISTVLMRGTKVTDSGLTNLKSHPIELLDLTGTQVTGAGLANLKGLPIKRLLLGGTKITDDDLKQLQGLPLEWLFLNNTGVTDKGLANLASLPLRALNLSGTKITDSGLPALKSLSLVRLDLADTAVTDKGLGTLAEYTELAIVSLGGTKVSDEGKKELKSRRAALRILNREEEKSGLSDIHG